LAKIAIVRRERRSAACRQLVSQRAGEPFDL